LGNSNPASTGVYAQVNGGAVVLTGALAMWELDKLVRAMHGVRNAAVTETVPSDPIALASSTVECRRRVPMEVDI
jgi:hypothetical protein